MMFVILAMLVCWSTPIKAESSLPVPTNQILTQVGRMVSVPFTPLVDPTTIGLTFEATVKISNPAILMPIRLTSPSGCNGGAGILNPVTFSYRAVWACVEPRYLRDQIAGLSFLGRSSGTSDVTFSECVSDEKPIACPRAVRVRIRK